MIFVLDVEKKINRASAVNRICRQWPGPSRMKTWMALVESEDGARIVNLAVPARHTVSTGPKILTNKIIVFKK